LIQNRLSLMDEILDCRTSELRSDNALRTLLKKTCLNFNWAFYSTQIFTRISDGSGSKNFDPGQVVSILCGSGRVGSAIYGLGLNLENFSFRSKKISLGWVRKYPGQRGVGLLFTAGQNLARVGSGPISNPYWLLLYISFYRNSYNSWKVLCINKRRMRINVDQTINQEWCVY